eukprot:7391625-Prymnesium_polylepis.1
MFVRDGLQRGDAVTPGGLLRGAWGTCGVLCEPPDRCRGAVWSSLAVGVARAGEALFWANFGLFGPCGASLSAPYPWTRWLSRARGRATQRSTLERATGVVRAFWGFLRPMPRDRGGSPHPGEGSAGIRPGVRPGRSALTSTPLVWLPGKLTWVLGKVPGNFTLATPSKSLLWYTFSGAADPRGVCRRPRAARAGSGRGGRSPRILWDARRLNRHDGDA